MGVFKPIVPLNCISFKVDDSGVHHGILRCQYPSPAVGWYNGQGLRLKDWLRVAIDVSNGFGRDRVWMQQVVLKVVQQNFTAKRVLLMLLFGAVVEAVRGGLMTEVWGWEGRFKVAVGGSNRFGKVRWLRKIRIGGRFSSSGGPLFGLRFWLRKSKKGYNDCVLRLEGCPKDNVGGNNNFDKDQIWVQQKTLKGSVADFCVDRL
ncbi:hypothetical protein BHM03_00057885 [Ensete ventricosum]|nr:hypothetical protein BHM03_00057885 [Ensete ventricosum]